MTYYVVYTLLLAFVVFVAIYHAPKRPAWAATIVFAVIVAATPAIYFDTLSRPKLLSDEWRDDKEVEILAYSPVEGQAVYYWMRLPGIDEPRYYYEEWSEEAKKRVEEMQEAAERGERMKMLMPFEPSLSEEKKLHGVPQPKLLEKPPQPQVKQFSI